MQQLIGAHRLHDGGGGAHAGGARALGEGQHVVGLFFV